MSVTTNINVANEEQLNQAIAFLDSTAASGAYSITFTSSITEGTDSGDAISFDGKTLSAVPDLYAFNLASNVSVTIYGQGNALIGNGYNALFVYQGDVTVENLVIADATATGGASSYGGGGAGLGGGLFVAGQTQGATGGHVTLSNVAFINDGAAGGSGNSGSRRGIGAGGGGGGLDGGAGGFGAGSNGGGGGGGGGGVGPSASGGASNGGSGVGGIILGAAGGGAGDGGGSGGSAGGGGGGGGHGQGGGGGVGGKDDIGGNGDGGFGGGGGSWGSGGFGGGGGGGSAQQNQGGFGGGGGSDGNGGFGGGRGGQYNTGGGGGLGAGGDIFVQQGGSLTIEGGSLGAGTVTGGTGFSDGSGLGSAIFLQGNQTQTFAPASGSTLTISGTIADESGSTVLPGDGTGTGAAGILIDGAGTVALDATNTFTGGITLDSGTLLLGAAGAAGTGAITFGAGDPPVLEFTAADAPTNAIEGFAAGDTIEILGFTATSSNYVSGAGLEVTNGVTTVTLDIPETTVPPALSVVVDGANTEIMAGLAPPGLSGTTSSLSTTDEATVKPFATVLVTDPDIGAADSVTITLSNAANGVLSGAGLSASGNGVYTLAAASPSAVSVELDALVFTPTAHQVAPGSTVTTGITLTVLNAGGPVQSTSSLVATAVNDPPSLTGATASLSTTDEAAVKPFATLSVADPDAGAAESVTITLSNAANGVLSGAGLTASGNGVYTLATASPPAISAELDALVFTPTAHQAAPGSIVTTGITLAVSNDGGPAVTSQSSINATAVNDAPSITGAVAGQTTAAGTAIKPFGTVSITDPDTGVTDSLAITLLNSNGVATDADGTLSGTGLTKTGTGAYSLTAATPSALSTDVDALVFTPAASQTAVTTSFALAASQIAGGSTATATNSSTSVTVSAPVVPTTRYIYGPIYGNGVIEGTAGNDVITAYGWYNTIYDNGGNDVVYAGQGDATVYTSTGNVTVTLGGYYNTVSGGDGATTVSGAEGNTAIILGNGNDSISAGGYDDTVKLGNGNDIITGPQGDATVTVGTGSDNITLGGYSNVVHAGSSTGTDIVNAGLGNATVTGGNGNFTVTVGGYSDVVTLGNGTDVVTGMQGEAMVTTGSGNDTIVLSGWGSVVNAGGGMNFITGGSGNDTFFLPVAGTGLDTISNFTLGNGDILNLAAALSATSWNSQAGTLGNYLKVTQSSGTAMIGIVPTGTGATTTIADISGANFTLAQLLPHLVV